MSQSADKSTLLAAHREEKKILQAEIQKMKHSLAKGNKRTKKVLNAEILKKMSDLEIKHAKELEEFESTHQTSNCSNKDVENVANDQQLPEVDNDQHLAEVENDQQLPEVENDQQLPEVENDQQLPEVENDQQLPEVANDHQLPGISNNHMTKVECHQNDISEDDNQDLAQETAGYSKEQTLPNFPSFKYKNKFDSRQSKAQRRRVKKEIYAKEREKYLKDQEGEMEQLKAARYIELERLNNKFLDRLLHLHEIPSDGDCLYRAIQHQLSRFNYTKDASVEQLRRLTAKHLLANKEEYMPFLVNPLSGEAMTEAEYEQYCDDIVTKHAWGGHVEVQALSRICGLPIEVLQAEGPDLVAGDVNSEHRLLLSFHRYAYTLGEHYNSLIPTKLSKNDLNEFKNEIK